MLLSPAQLPGLIPKEVRDDRLISFLAVDGTKVVNSQSGQLIGTGLGGVMKGVPQIGIQNTAEYELLLPSQPPRPEAGAAGVRNTGTISRADGKLVVEAGSILYFSIRPNNQLVSTLPGRILEELKSNETIASISFHTECTTTDSDTRAEGWYRIVLRDGKSQEVRL